MNNTGARKSVFGAVAIAAVWLGGMTTFSLMLPMSGDFRTHMLSGLAMFSVIILGPLLALLATLNWVVRRVAGFIIIGLFFGMIRGALSQGFGPLSDIGIVFVTAALVGSMLFFISRTAVMGAVGDFYSFLRPADLFSRWTFHRKTIRR